MTSAGRGKSMSACVICQRDALHGGLCCQHRYDEQPPCAACPDAGLETEHVMGAIRDLPRRPCGHRQWMYVGLAGQWVCEHCGAPRDDAPDDGQASR